MDSSYPIGSGGSNDRSATERLLEQQNDDQVAAMYSRVSRIKQITMDIHDDVEAQNVELDGMGQSFNSFEGQLGRTFGQLKANLQMAWNRRMWQVVAAVVVLFLFIILIWRKASR